MGNELVYASSFFVCTYFLKSVGIKGARKGSNMYEIKIKTEQAELSLYNAFIIEIKPVFLPGKKAMQYQVHLTSMGEPGLREDVSGIIDKLINNCIKMMDSDAPDDKGFIYGDDNGDKIPLVSIGAVYDRDTDEVYTLGLRHIPFFVGLVLATVFQMMDEETPDPVKKLMRVAPPVTGYQKLYKVLEQCHDGVGDIYIADPDEYQQFVKELDIVTAIPPVITNKYKYFSFFHDGKVFAPDKKPCWDKLYRARDIIKQVEECSDEHVMGMEFVNH